MITILQCHTRHYVRYEDWTKTIFLVIEGLGGQWESE